MVRTNTLLERIVTGVRHAPLKLLGTIFLAYSAFWVILEPLLALVPEANPYLIGIGRFVVLLILSVIVGLLLAARPNKISFDFQNNKITIEFGDLFQQQGIKVIPVSRYMHETDVVQTSLQSLIIKKYRDAEEGVQGLATYSAKVEAALANKDHIMTQRDPQQGGEKQYPIGTLGLIERRDEKYLLLALTESERSGHIPQDNCDLARLWIALESLWDQISSVARGEDVSIPLLGTGVYGIPLSPIHLLSVNILAILNTAEKQNVRLTVGEIKIVIHPKYFDTIDLRTIKQAWIHPY
jgi:hypothetical protein